MPNKRSFSITITPVTGAGSAIKMDGTLASNFWNMYSKWLNGQGDQRGFEYSEEVDVGEEDSPQMEIHRKTILFKNIQTVDKAPTVTTETTDFDCEDI